MARDIRYAFYQECTGSVGRDQQQSKCGVIFGHHMGDVQENVISNVMRYIVGYTTIVVVH